MRYGPEILTTLIKKSSLGRLSQESGVSEANISSFLSSGEISLREYLKLASCWGLEPAFEKRKRVSQDKSELPSPEVSQNEESDFVIRNPKKPGLLARIDPKINNSKNLSKIDPLVDLIIQVASPRLVFLRDLFNEARAFNGSKPRFLVVMDEVKNPQAIEEKIVLEAKKLGLSTTFVVSIASLKTFCEKAYDPTSPLSEMFESGMLLFDANASSRTFLSEASQGES